MSEKDYQIDKNGYKILRTISPNDEMYNAQPNLDIYLAISASAMNCIDLALRHAESPPPRSVLDLPCGHGRVLRSLVSYFPKARHVACDLNRDGVDFCADTFGVEGVYSEVDVSQIPIDEKFSLIWCGSLLTHLSAENSRAFLDFFIEHLEDDGILVASLHGRRALALHCDSNADKLIGDQLFRQMLEGYHKVGYGYADYPAKKGYGVSLTGPAWLAKYIQNRLDSQLLYYSERLLGDHHDVFAIQKKTCLAASGGDLYRRSIEKKTWHTPLDLEPLPALTHTAQIALDHFGPALPGSFFARGWGLLDGVDSDESRKYVVLKNAENTYFFETDNACRPDVTAHLGAGQHDNSGFETLFLTTGVLPGTYQAGLLIVNGENAGIAYAPDASCVVE